MLIVRLGFLVVGMVFVAVAIPLIRRRIPPNGGYGLRVPATFADEWVWYEANARAARALVALGLALAALALVLPELWPLTPDQLIWILVAVLLLGVLTTAVWGWGMAERLLRERRARGDS